MITPSQKGPNANTHTHIHTQMHKGMDTHVGSSDHLPDNQLEEKSLGTMCTIQKESTSDSSFSEEEIPVRPSEPSKNVCVYGVFSALEETVKENCLIMRQKCKYFQC